MKEKIKITYVYHSCFVQEYKGKTLLFDPPGSGFLPNGLWDLVEEVVRDRDLYVFISHGHGDHYNPKVFEVEAKEVHYIVPDDIHYHEKAVVLSDGDIRKVGDLHVRTFKSNDQGLAYLIKADGCITYFGGDLAKWDWPEWSEKEREEHVGVFHDTLEQLRGLDVDVAYSNMDKRLESWAGPQEFIREIKPKYFVPIHTFGNEEWIDDLINSDLPEEATIFRYREPGDHVIWDILERKR